MLIPFHVSFPIYIMTKFSLLSSYASKSERLTVCSVLFSVEVHCVHTGHINNCADLEIGETSKPYSRYQWKLSEFFTEFKVLYNSKIHLYGTFICLEMQYRAVNGKKKISFKSTVFHKKKEMLET